MAAATNAKRSGRTRPPPPPGPRGHWLLGSLPEIRRDMPQTLLDVTRDYGGLTRLRVGPATMYLVGDADLIHEAITQRAGEFRKSNRTRASLDGHLGSGLITLEGAEHRRHRRIMNPVLHSRSVAAQAQVMVELARRRAQSWTDGAPVNLLAEMADLTLRIVCAALFHLDSARSRLDGDPDAAATDAQAADEAAEVEAAEVEELVAAVHEFAGSLNLVLRRPFPVPGWVPTRLNRVRRVTVARVDRIAYRLIRHRRQTGAGGSDLLSLLVDAQDADGGSRLSDVEIRDELMTMFFAGHETSAAALTWAFLLLAEHPSVAAGLRDEIARVVGERPASAADLAQLPLLGQVVAETLRLYPPAWVFDRSPVRDVVLGGHRIPRGATILFSPWVVHRNPALWPVPEQFRPQRFAEGAQLPPHAYLPFGDGPRRCVGNRFAEAEIALVLATILPRVELSRVDDAPIRPEGDATLRPKGGLLMTVSRR